MSLQGAAEGLKGATKQSPHLHNQHAHDGIASRTGHRASLLAMTKWLFNLKNIKAKSSRLLDFQIFGLFLLVILTSCSANPNKQGKGEADLQGEWKQDSIAGQKAMVAYSLYNMKFDCDSFVFRLDTYSSVNAGANSCTTNGHKIEYVKGTYRRRNDSLFMKGYFCKADKTLLEEGSCYRWGPYQEIFKVDTLTASSMKIRSIGSVLPVNAHLIKHTNCTPKPL